MPSYFHKNFKLFGTRQNLTVHSIVSKNVTCSIMHESGQHQDCLKKKMISNTASSALIKGIGAVFIMHLELIIRRKRFMHVNLTLPPYS